MFSCKLLFGEISICEHIPVSPFSYYYLSLDLPQMSSTLPFWGMLIPLYPLCLASRVPLLPRFSLDRTADESSTKSSTASLGELASWPSTSSTMSLSCLSASPTVDLSLSTLPKVSLLSGSLKISFLPNPSCSGGP